MVAKKRIDAINVKFNCKSTCFCERMFLFAENNYPSPKKFPNFGATIIRYPILDFKQYRNEKTVFYSADRFGICLLFKKRPTH